MQMLLLKQGPITEIYWLDGYYIGLPIFHISYFFVGASSLGTF